MGTEYRVYVRIETVDEHGNQEKLDDERFLMKFDDEFDALDLAARAEDLVTG